jgi:hypothetical protein
MQDVTYSEMVLTYYEHYYFNNPEEMKKHNIELNSDKEKAWFEHAKKLAAEGKDPFEHEKEFNELYASGKITVPTQDEKQQKPKFDDKLEIDDSLFEQFNVAQPIRTI